MSLKDVLKGKSREEINKDIDEIVKSFDIYVYKELIGKIIKSIKRIDNSEIIFTFLDGESWIMYHQQDCCEQVYIESVQGDLEDLIDSPLLIAEERCGDNPGASESGTWTFYTFATLKGYVDIRWNGESNGYYSEGVSFEKQIEE